MAEHDRATVADPRRRLLESGPGTRPQAFGPTEWGLLAAVAAIWGSSFLFIDVGLDAFRPGVVTMARVCLGALALSLIPKARRPIDRQDRLRVALLGTTWIGIPLLLFPIAQQWIDSSVAGMLNGAVPLTTALWSVFLRHHPPGRVQLVGLAIGFLGVVAISLPELQGSRATATGAGLVVLAVVLYGLSVNIAVPLQQRYGALPVLWRAQLVALVIVIPFGLWSLPGSSWAMGPALAMVPLGVLGTGLAFVLMITLVGRVGGPRGSIATYFVPVVAIGLGVVVLEEEIALAALAGTGLVLVGAWLTSRRERPATSAGVPRGTS